MTKTGGLETVQCVHDKISFHEQYKCKKMLDYEKQILVVGLVHKRIWSGIENVLANMKYFMD